MPYIKKEDRKKWEQLTFIMPATAGELNYFITKLCLFFAGDKPNYAKYNEIIGVLECCKLEFYRRVLAKYEDTKIKENGDIY